MSENRQAAVVNFTVRALPSAQFGVFESGFEKSIAEFTDLDTAEQYALRLAEAKPRWKVDVYDASGTLAGTYNSEDDAMPKPAVT